LYLARCPFFPTSTYSPGGSDFVLHYMKTISSCKRKPLAYLQHAPNKHGMVKQSQLARMHVVTTKKVYNSNPENSTC